MRPREILGYVFGYGSLANPDDWLLRRCPGDFPDPTHVLVDGFRRHWDLAAENAAAIHDGKYHVDPVSGERPDIFVATLGLEHRESCRCNGLAIPVDAERLGWLDQREGLLYDRIVVEPERVEAPIPGTLWTYFPKSSALAAFEEGLREGNAFVPRDYVEGLQEVFTAHGEEALAAFRASTRPPRCPQRNLELVRAPGNAGI